MKTKIYFMTAIATILFASATFTASAQRFFPPRRFFPAPVHVGVRIGIPAPIIPIPAVCAPAPVYYGPAPVVVGGGYYRDRVVVERRAPYGYRGYRRW